MQNIIIVLFSPACGILLLYIELLLLVLLPTLLPALLPTLLPILFPALFPSLLSPGFVSGTVAFFIVITLLTLSVFISSFPFDAEISFNVIVISFLLSSFTLKVILNKV